MKALVFYEFKEGCVEVRDVPVPEIGPDDVLLRVKAAAVCGSDVERIHCHSESTVTPVIVGHEFCGVVERVGANVKRWKPGDRAVSENTGHVCGQCYACGVGRFLNCPERKMLGGKIDGGFAEFVRIPGEVLKIYPKTLMRLPDNLSFEEGAILEPSANAYYAVAQEGALQLGQNVAIFGPGCIGLFAVAWARLGGAANIVLIGGSRDRLEFGRRQGAHHPVNYREIGGTVAEAVAGLVGKDQIDLVVDCAGGKNVMADSLAMARPGARMVKVGWAGAETVNLNPGMRKGVEIIGHLGYDTVSWDRVIRMAAAGMLDYKQFVSATFPLDRWREAFQGMEERKYVKAVFNSFQ